MITAGQPTLRSFAAIGTICHVLSTRPDVAAPAAGLVKAQLAELDLACSRFRPDSELNLLPQGRQARISALLTELLAVAIRTARRTDGLVDPTVGRAIRSLGYDDDLPIVQNRTLTPAADELHPAPGFWRLMLDQHDRTVVIPRGIELDLGASAKAWAADRAARSCAAQLPGGFLVNLGGDIAISGEVPAGGWRVAIDDATEADSRHWPVVTIKDGAVATSSTALRTWQVGDRLRHHIVDPRTGDVAEPVWRAVTVVAASAELANAAATAAVVLGRDAPYWLAHRRLPARLMSHQGLPVYIGDWPDDEPQRQSA
jgi:thiamine biosynthesis lipoprotein